MSKKPKPCTSGAAAAKVSGGWARASSRQGSLKLSELGVQGLGFRFRVSRFGFCIRAWISVSVLGV